MRSSPVHRPGSSESRRLPGRRWPYVPSGTTLLAAALLVAGGACARQAAPPGGPEDRLPPAVVATEPDTFATVEPSRRGVVVRFSERVSERPTSGSLDQAVVVSPATSEVRVSHRRDGLEISLVGGWREGIVYRVTLLPVIRDMFGNAMMEPYEMFFSTGPPFTPNVFAGIVTDRITGRVVEGARVDAIPQLNPQVYTARTDSAGVFAMRYLPAGLYQLRGYEDRNRNGEPDYSEPQRVIVANLAGGAAADTVIIPDLPLLPLDTTAAQLVSVAAADSITVQLTFDDYLDPLVPLDSVRVTLTAQSGTAPPVARILHEHELGPYMEALRDSLAAAADTTTPPPDTVPPEPEEPALPPGFEEELEEEADTVAPPLPSRVIAVALAGLLVPEALYDVEVTGVTNIAGTREGGGTASFEVPAPPPDTTAAADTTGAAADTTGAAADTTGAAADTTGAVADTTGAAADTTGAVADTTGAAADTTGAVADTTGAVADTTGAAADTTGAVADTTGAAADTAGVPPDTTAVPPDTTAAGGAPARPDTVPRDTIPRDTLVGGGGSGGPTPGGPISALTLARGGGSSGPAVGVASAGSTSSTVGAVPPEGGLLTGLRAALRRLRPVRHRPAPWRPELGERTGAASHADPHRLAAADRFPGVP